MITPITATFPALNFPKEVDYPTQEDWAAFSAAAELNYGILSGEWSTKSQEFKSQTNNLAFEIQEIGENAINAISLNSIEDLATYTGTGLVMVKDINRGGIFISKTAVEINPNTGSLYVVDGGIVFAKLGGGFWARQYTGSVSVKWFDAKGDGVTDDTMAIENAFDYLGSTGGILEFEPNSTYIISPLSVEVGGTTGRSQFSYTLGMFNGLQSVLIKGNGATVKYSGNFYYGYFNNLMQPVNQSSGGKPYTPAGFMSLVNNNYVKIENLKVIGALTSDTATVNFGGVGTDVRQIGGMGFNLNENIKVECTSVIVEGMLFDGFYSKQTSLNSSTLMSNCNSIKCNRQGLTLAASQLFTAIDCNFSETGRANYSGNTVSPPSSCLDIESEGGVIKNASFINCILHNSTGRSLEFFESGGNSISNIKFFGGQISGPGGISTAPSDTLFESVKIGTYIFNNSDPTKTLGVVPINATTYKNCNFIRNSGEYNYSGAWFTSLSCTGGLFDNCVFENKDNTFVQQSMAGTLDGGYATFNNCIYIDPVATSNLGFKGQFTGNISCNANGQNFYSSPTRSCFFETNINGKQKIVGSTSNNGSVPALNSFYFNGMTVYVGSGSPSGVVFANVGSIYLNLSGGTSTTLYVKETNSGFSNGWVAK